MSLCGCGSGLEAELCCAPIMSGRKQAATAEALMRSRFMAYREGDASYILRSWHSTTRPEALDLSGDAQWLRLQVLDHRQQADGCHAQVEFVAHYMSNGQPGQMHELSRFVKEGGEWFYLDGDQLEPVSQRVKPPGRNDPCNCGSGKKYKKCCGANR